MKKFFLRLFILMLLLLVAFAGWFAWTGIETANRYLQSKSLESAVAAVQSSPDYVAYQDVAPFLYDATVAVEDARFFDHDGIDIKALIRALASQFLPFMPSSGGSTITQQVVKNLYGQYEGGVNWKAAEIFLALRMEQLYSKEDILSIYVNIINYGDHHQGIRQASLGYFGVEPAWLSDAQASLLAGIPQAPTFYQLSDRFNEAKIKQKVVLDAMVRNGMITQDQADSIYATPVAFAQLSLPELGGVFYSYGI